MDEGVWEYRQQVTAAVGTDGSETKSNECRRGQRSCDREPAARWRREKVAIFAAKLLVTGACFWYVSRQINLGQVLSAVPLLDFRWPYSRYWSRCWRSRLGLRWRNIVDALAVRDERVTRAVMIAVTAIGAFFAQVLPSVAGDGVRAWLLVRRGCDWRNAVMSVVIDRGVGAGLLIALGFVILLLPSASSRSADIARWCSSRTARCCSPPRLVSCSRRG